MAEPPSAARTTISDSRLQEMHRVMLLERRIAERHAEWLKAYGFATTGVRMGGEAIAAGVCYALKRRADVGPDKPVDMVVGVYGRLHMGCSLEGILAEMLGRTTGYCGGVASNLSFVATEFGVQGFGGIVGSLIPVATGIAWGAKQDSTGQVVACFFGDGASNSGAFHEGLNLAAVHKVPAIFLCSNNGYAISTPATQTTSVEQISVRAQSYGIPGVTVDGTDVLAVHEAVSEAAERARAGGGPSLIEAKFWRWGGYGPDDDQSYRSREELESVRLNDPVKKFQEHLEERGILGSGDVDRIEREIQEEIGDALQAALAAPEADPASLYDNVYPD